MDSSAAFPAIFVIIIVFISVVSFVIWLWSLIHCINNRYLTDQNRLIGILLIVLLQFLGSIIYLFLPRESSPQR